MSFVKQFCSYTTAHGLGRFASSHSKGKIFWIIVVFACYIGSIIHFSLLVARFIEKPLLTTYDKFLEYKFPDIYICPKNPISISQLVKPLTHSETSRVLKEAPKFLKELDPHQSRTFAINERQFDFDLNLDKPFINNNLNSFLWLRYLLLIIPFRSLQTANNTTSYLKNSIYNEKLRLLFLHDFFGHATLLQLFGNDLQINMIDCYVNQKECNKNDFTTFAHPTIGTCYKFKKERFIKNLDFIDQTNLKLSMKLFSDASDVKGNVVSSTEDIETILNPELDLKSRGSIGYEVFILPDGEFPHHLDYGHGYTVATGMRTDVRVTLNKNEVHPKSGCIAKNETSDTTVTYRINAWKSLLTLAAVVSDDSDKFNPHEMARKINYTYTTATEILVNLKTAWEKRMNLSRQFPDDPDLEKHVMTFKSTTLDCTNQFIVDKFIQNCNCLPSFLPIPEKYFTDYNYCFSFEEHTTVSTLNSAYDCYQNQTRKLRKMIQESKSVCNNYCAVSNYDIETKYDNWPPYHVPGMLQFLKQITGIWGFPDNFAKWRGLCGLYFQYLEKQKLEFEKDFKNTQELSQFLMQTRAIRRNFAWLSIKAQSQYGEYILEEEAYPLKNLLADLGGLLGLWSGISVLTICELLELGFLVYLTKN